MYEELDAELLGRIARRLFSESVTDFRKSHQLGMKSLNAHHQQFKEFHSAIDGEEEALQKQREAINTLKEAWNIRAKRLECVPARKKHQK